MSKVAAAPDSPVMTVRVAARLAEQRGESMAQLPTTGLRAIADAFTGTVEALGAIVESAVTDADTCAICLCPLDRHASGCSVAWAAAALAKARGES